ncbi:MAG TPA: hypothetical protein VK907_13660 [Phnomibacter sp.]|nr:hypothetical protein [Phnomibacter sp.]
MNKRKALTADILDKTVEIGKRYPSISRHLTETPVQVLDYSDPKIDQQELEDYHHSISLMISHSDPTSIGDNGKLQTHPRPDAFRELDAPLMQFDLQAETENIKQEGNWVAGNQSAKTLMRSDDLRIVLIALHQDNEMKMHETGSPLTLQVLEGSIQFETLQDSTILHMGALISLHACVQHNVIAKERSILLLTLLNMPSDKDANEKEEKEENEKEVVEGSDNINFPDFPTYPPEDDIYIAPDEKENIG